MVDSVTPVRSAPQQLPRRLPSLTGMRFIAAAVVFGLHAIVEGLFASPSVYDGPFKMFFWGGGAGVSFFFILSGFVLTWSAQAGTTTGSFWRRRFFKIYPNHLLTFAAALVLLAAIGQPSRTVPAVLNALLLQAWSWDFTVIASVNSVAWSLSCEAFFYLCFPLLFLLVRKIRPERLWAWAAGVVAAIFSVPLFAMLLPAATPFPIGLNTWQTWFIYQFPPIRLLDFVFGMLLAQVVITGRRLPIGFPGAAVLAVLVYLATPFLPPTFAIVAAMTVPLGLVVATGARADVEGRRTGLGGPTWVLLGELSFAFYLWHRLVIVSGHHLTGFEKKWSTPAGIALCLGFFVVTLSLAYLTYVAFERPVMRRFAGSRPRADVTGSPVPAGPVPAGPVPAVPGQTGAREVRR